MPRKANLLHVRTHLEHVESTITAMLEDNEKHKSTKGVWGLHIPEIYEHDLRIIRLITRAILKKHKERNTRKDIYIQADSSSSESDHDRSQPRL